MHEPDRPADILVVEDEPDIRHCLDRLLKREGHAVATSENAEQALKYLSGHPLPRVILLDLVMPDMDGWQFLHERRRHPGLRSVPVVVFSAALGSRGPDPLDIGATEVLRKPYAMAEVLDATRRYCPAPAATAQAAHH
jgi:CheY-like chemotaxis protein